jgi:hypothetical protein
LQEDLVLLDTCAPADDEDVKSLWCQAVGIVYGMQSMSSDVPGGVCVAFRLPALLGSCWEPLRRWTMMYGMQGEQ